MKFYLFPTWFPQFKLLSKSLYHLLGKNSLQKYITKKKTILKQINCIEKEQLELPKNSLKN